MKPIHRTDPSIPDRRGRRAATAALAAAVLLPAGLLAALPGSPAHAEPYCPPEDFPCIEDPVPEPDEMPPALGTVQITSRTTTSTAPGAASFAFRLLIPARATSWSLQRQLSSGWTSVRSGSSTGTPHYLTTSHTGLTPDQRYCYRLVATNTNGSSTTTPLCAYTRDGRDIDVSRIQVRLETADISDAGTSDQDVRVAINGAYPNVSAESTWLDHGRNDFERGDVHYYDLLLDRIGELGDINGMTVENQSDDDWCVKAVTLKVDGKTAYHRDYGTSSCRWLGADSASTRVVYSHDDLRASSYWRSFQEVVPYVLTQLSDGSWRATMTYPRARIEQMIEATVGNAIHPNPLYWGHSYGRSVEARRIATRGIGVDLDLAANVFGPDPEVDIDFDLWASASLTSTGVPVADVAMSNFDVDVDYALWIDIVTLGLTTAVANEIESQVRNQAPTFDDHIVGDVEGIDEFSVRVTADADLVFTAILR